MKNSFLNFVVFILVLLLVQGCGKKNQVDPKQIVMKFQQAYNNRDTAAIAQLYSEDATYIVSGEAEPIHGRAAIEQNQITFFRAFPDLTVEFTNIFTSKDQFCVEWLTKGTHTGPLATPEGDIPPTGRTVEFKGAFFANLTPEGLIAEDRTYYDTVSFMNQLGLNEQPEETLDK